MLQERLVLLLFFNDEVILKSLRTGQWKHLLCALGPSATQTI